LRAPEDAGSSRLSGCLMFNISCYLSHNISAEYFKFIEFKGLLQNENFATALSAFKKAKDWLYEPVIGII
jgi:hypothetical protein